MDKRGFSLVELVVVLAIAGILLSVATMQFHRMAIKSGVEGEISELHSDLMAARSNALFGKKGAVVTVNGGSFALYSSATLVGTPIRQKSLKYPLTLAVENPNSSTASFNIFFDPEGVASFGSGAAADPSLTQGVICAGDRTSDASADSLVVGATMISLGKNNATGCSSANISRK